MSSPAKGVGRSVFDSPKKSQSKKAAKARGKIVRGFQGSRKGKCGEPMRARKAVQKN